MRDHNKAFCRLVSESFDCPGPVLEFGSYQVEGQEGYANLRRMFPGKSYLGCDMRAGPGVDRVEDVSDVNLPNGAAGTILCIETFEHVFEIRRAFDEVFRLLLPGGVFVITTPLNFRIHGYPDDYWRMTPNCLRRLLSCYTARVVGHQGHSSFPHSIMGIGIKAPIPSDAQRRIQNLVSSYRSWLRTTEASLPLGVKLRRAASRLYRSRGERNQIRDYYAADFTVEIDGLPDPPATTEPLGRRAVSNGRKAS